MINNEVIMNAMKSSVRTIEGRAYLFNADGSTAYTFRSNEYLKSFTIERVGVEDRFFGFGIGLKANIKARDKNRALTLDTSMRVRPFYVDRSSGSGVSFFTYPHLNITEVHRDENTNEISITAYDALNKATKHTVSELTLADSYSLADFVSACASLLGTSSYTLVGMDGDTVFTNTYTTETANFEGTETIRDALNAVAEATQTIYYINRNNVLTFRRLLKDEEPNLTITKEDYITLDSKTNRRITSIIHATELGDNISASLPEAGTTQVIRNNPFWELRDDVATLVDNALAAMGGFTINQFTCSWRGNYLLEPGDKIALTTKDDNTVISYVINDVLTYDGTLKEQTSWNYSAEEGKTDSNPTNLGEALKQTFARVDKANKQIDMVVSESSANAEAVAAIQINLDGINTSVSNIEKLATDSVETLNEQVATLKTQVDAAITSEAVELAIKSELNKGVEKVVTSTGFTFDETGLTVSKSNSDMETSITEDGMVIYKNSDEVLVANNSGVVARNLHANTYLIIGTNSRFEDYDNDTRTGCFWIGS